MRHEIEGKRKQIIAIPSVMRAEFTRELEKAEIFSERMRKNLERENAKQKNQMGKMKQKYDREGV